MTPGDAWSWRDLREHRRRTVSRRHPSTCAAPWRRRGELAEASAKKWRGALENGQVDKAVLRKRGAAGCPACVYASSARRVCPPAASRPVAKGRLTTGRGRWTVRGADAALRRSMLVSVRSRCDTCPFRLQCRAGPRRLHVSSGFPPMAEPWKFDGGRAERFARCRPGGRPTKNGTAQTALKRLFGRGWAAVRGPGEVAPPAKRMVACLERRSRRRFRGRLSPGPANSNVSAGPSWEASIRARLPALSKPVAKGSQAVASDPTRGAGTTVFRFPRPGEMSAPPGSAGRC